MSSQEEQDLRLAVALQCQENIEAFKERQLAQLQVLSNDDDESESQSVVSSLVEQDEVEWIDNNDNDDGARIRIKAIHSRGPGEQAQVIGRTFAAVAASAANEKDKNAASQDAARGDEQWPALSSHQPVSSDDYNATQPNQMSRKAPPTTRIPNTTSTSASSLAWRKNNSHRGEGYWYDIMDDTRVEADGGGDPIFQALLGQYGDTTPLALEMRHLPLDTPIKPMYATALAAAASADATETSFLQNPQQVLDQFCKRMNGISPDYAIETLPDDDEERVYQCHVYHSSNEQILGV
jgi:hypothetical protein